MGARVQALSFLLENGCQILDNAATDMHQQLHGVPTSKKQIFKVNAEWCKRHHSARRKTTYWDAKDGLLRYNMPPFTKHTTKKFFTETHHSSHHDVESWISGNYAVMSWFANSSRPHGLSPYVMCSDCNSSRGILLKISHIRTNVTSDEFLL